MWCMLADLSDQLGNLGPMPIAARRIKEVEIIGRLVCSLRL